MIKYLFGWLATILSGLYRIPQIYKIYKVKKVEGISKVSYIVQTTSYVMYIIHGYIATDHPIIVMGVISVLQNIIILSLYIYYKKIEKTNVSKEDIS